MAKPKQQPKVGKKAPASNAPAASDQVTPPPDGDVSEGVGNTNPPTGDGAGATAGTTNPPAPPAPPPPPAPATPAASEESAAKPRKAKVRVLSEATRDGQTVRVLTDDVRVWKEVV